MPVQEGLAEIDINVAEQALRAVTLGKKSYLLFGLDHGGDRSAMMCNLAGTCKFNGINPEAYICHILCVLAD